MGADQDKILRDAEKVREITKWTKRYAENRTLTIFVIMAMVSVFGGISLLFAFGLASLGKGKMPLTMALVFVFVAMSIILIIFVVKFGGKKRGLIDQIVGRWIYGKEGTVLMSQPQLSKKKKWLDIILGVVVTICTLGVVNLGVHDYIALKYLQPVIALYFVPFLIIEYFLQRPRFGALLLISPILLSIHAVLILSGVPIFFTGTFAVSFNMVIPVAYMFLAYLAGHLYSRYALRKLKAAAKVNEGGVDGV